MLSTDISTENLQVRRGWHRIIKVNKGEIYKNRHSIIKANKGEKYKNTLHNKAIFYRQAKGK